MESRTLATAHVGRSWIAYQRIYKFSATNRVISCCCQSKHRRLRTFRGLSSVRICRGFESLMGVTWCSLVIGSRFLSGEKWTMTTDGRFPVPDTIPTPNAQRIIANSLHAVVFLHKSLDTRDNARLSSFFYEVWGSLGWALERKTRSETWQRRSKVISLPCGSSYFLPKFTISSLGSILWRLRVGSATCVDSFVRFPGFTLRFEADFDAKEVVWSENRLKSSVTGRRCRRDSLKAEICM